MKFDSEKQIPMIFLAGPPGAGKSRLGEKAANVLDLFSDPPWTIEFKRKFSNSPNAIDRYKRSLKGFTRFLEKNKKREVRRILFVIYLNPELNSYVAFRTFMQDNPISYIKT